MSMQSLLDQILRSANAGPGKTDLGKYATGAVAGGALALLLGSKRGRGLGGKALKYGSAAALGVLAWNVYRDWQSKQGGSRAAAPGAAAAPTTPTAQSRCDPSHRKSPP